MQVRSAYQKQDFEWENMKKLAFKVRHPSPSLPCPLSRLVQFTPVHSGLAIVASQMVDESNTRLMRDYILETTDIDNET